jgi:starch phosphorylase
MTRLGLNLSEFINGVAKKHSEVSRNMFPGYEISAITNGVHTFTWTCDSFKKLYDKYLPGWANEPELFVRIGRVLMKRSEYAFKKNSVGLCRKPEFSCIDILTIGFMRGTNPTSFSDIE